MRIGDLDTVFFWVEDLDASTEWYVAVLEMEPVARHGGWQIMSTGAVTFALHEGKGPHSQVNAVVAFAVTDLDSAIEQLAAIGIDPTDPVTDTGRARFVTISDPDGNHIQLLERS